MHQDHCQAARAYRLRLPIAEALHAAAILRIDFNQLGHRGTEKRRSWQIIAKDGLQVSIFQTPARLEWRQSSLQHFCCIGMKFILGNFRAHKDSAIRLPQGSRRIYKLGRLVEIERYNTFYYQHRIHVVTVDGNAIVTKDHCTLDSPETVCSERPSKRNSDFTLASRIAL